MKSSERESFSVDGLKLLVVAVALGWSVLLWRRGNTVLPFYVVAGLVFWLCLSRGLPPALSLTKSYAKQQARIESLAAGLVEAGFCGNPNSIRIRSSQPDTYRIECHGVGQSQQNLARALADLLPLVHASDFEITELERDRYQVRFFSDSAAARLMCVEEPEVCWDSDFAAFPIGFDSTGIRTVDLESRGLLVAGIPGSGKSVLLRSIASLAAGSQHSLVCLISPKGLDFQGLGLAIADGARAGIDLLGEIDREVQCRKDYCERLGITKLTAADFSNERPHILVIVDEFAVLTSEVETDQRGKSVRVGKSLLAAIAKGIAEYRFAGVSFVICSQRVTAEIVPTYIRELLSQRFSFYQPDSEGYRMALGRAVDDSPIPSDCPGLGLLLADSGSPVLVRSFARTCGVRAEPRSRGTRGS